MASISKTIGYLRVSTIDQDLDKNKAEILRLDGIHRALLVLDDFRHHQ